MLSNRVLNIKPSQTLEINNKAKKMQANGIDIINLALGEPDYNTPEHIKNAAIDAINGNKTRYTQVRGTIDLRNAIVKKFKDDNNINYNSDEIIVSAGAKQIIFNAFMATINPNDEVIIPSPYWVSYIDNVELFEGRAVVVSTALENNFKITPQELENAITDRTKWLLINSPSNPTGAIYTKQELIDLGRVLVKYPNILIMSDDIYEYLLYDNNTFFTLAEVCPELKDRILTINGASKAFCMTGWRIGFAGGNKKLIDAMDAIQSQSTTNACSVSQEAVKFALLHDRNFLKPLIQDYQARRDFAFNYINNLKDLSTLKPQGAFYLFINIERLKNKKYKGEYLKNSVEFCQILLEEYHVATVPGLFFGADWYFRISFVCSVERLNTACDKIKEMIENFA